MGSCCFGGGRDGIGGGGGGGSVHDAEYDVGGVALVLTLVVEGLKVLLELIEC